MWIRTRLNQHLSFYLEAAKFNPCTPGPTSCSKPPLCPHPAPAFPPLWPRGLSNSPLASLVPAAGHTIATAPTQALLYWLLVYLPKVSLGVVRARSTDPPKLQMPMERPGHISAALPLSLPSGAQHLSSPPSWPHLANSYMMPVSSCFENSRRGCQEMLETRTFVFSAEAGGGKEMWGMRVLNSRTQEKSAHHSACPLWLSLTWPFSDT